MPANAIPGFAPVASAGVLPAGSRAGAFITAAGRMLRRSGTLYLVANRHMPYEEVLRAAFRSVKPLADEAGYKVFEARK